MTSAGEINWGERDNRWGDITNFVSQLENDFGPNAVLASTAILSLLGIKIDTYTKYDIDDLVNFLPERFAQLNQWLTDNGYSSLNYKKPLVRKVISFTPDPLPTKAALLGSLPTPAEQAKLNQNITTLAQSFKNGLEMGWQPKQLISGFLQTAITLPRPATHDAPQTRGLLQAITNTPSGNNFPYLQ